MAIALLEAPRVNHDHDLLTLATSFLVLSLFAVGGALSALPEMHRIAVEAQHWMTSGEFADMVAIAQLSPGQSWLAVVLMVAAGALSFTSRVNPMLLMLAGALLGFAGVI